ncbi:MAG: hypothetical protein R3E39_26425 [Anaerolineae bacterium]
MARSKPIKKQPVALPKQSKARLPQARTIEAKLKAANLMTGLKARGKNAQRNQMLSEFARLLSSRPTGTRHINRLVVDWTRVVESRLGVGGDLPVEKDGKSLFEHVVTAFLPPEVTLSAVAAYNALYGS